MLDVLGVHHHGNAGIAITAGIPKALDVGKAQACPNRETSRKTSRTR
jgi:D-tyrosyl-tRNA(Tyr) deacylase